MVNKKPRRWPPPGFSIPFWQGGLCPRLVAFYFFLSSHLQMQWQITPAMTERTKAMSSSVGQPPFPCRIGVATSALYHRGSYSAIRKALGADLPCPHWPQRRLEELKNLASRRKADGCEVFWCFGGLHQFLFVKFRIEIIKVLGIQLLLRPLQGLSEALEMDDLPGPQEF